MTMSENNKLIIAAAGSGKTTFLVNEALRRKEAKILITTYTLANEEEIRRKFIKINKCVPGNVTIQPWFSFLLQHGARPFQGCKYCKDIHGLNLINNQSAKYAKESDPSHYFDKNQKIYSDKLSKFAVKCNEESNGAVIDRLTRIYTDIFIDEVQDLAGYDLDFLKLLFECKINILLVGDPRQATYSTNNSQKNRQYKKANIVNFFENIPSNVDTDDGSLTINYRSCSAICEFSNKLYPNHQKTTSGSNCNTGHDGIFLVRAGDLKSYLAKFNPIQLRDNKSKEVDENYGVFTFGKSKGLEFERIIIYPTNPFIAWLNDNNYELAPTSRSKFYVAITRAKYSVAIVCDDNIKQIIGIENFKSE